MQEKLGIVAGGGDIPPKLVAKCIAENMPYFVLAVEDNADKNFFKTPNICHKWIRLGQVGTGLNIFQKEGVTQAVMIGTIKRPSLHNLMPDIKTAALIAKVGAKSLGDDGILKVLVQEIEKSGIKVCGIHQVMPELLVKNGVLGKTKPNAKNRQDIKRAIEVCLELGRLDVGQAVIVQEGLVLGVEGIEGTDELIKRCGTYKRKGSGGILLKLKKPQQDMRIDLPTIGIKTVREAKNAGLDGIVAHAGNGLIVNEAEVIAEADKLGLFIMGVNPLEF